MIRRKYMRTRQLRPGMKLDQSIVDRLGRNLVTRGAVIDEYIIEALINHGVMNVYIQEGEVEEEEVIISKAAQNQIDKLYTADRSKLSLSKSVRERISHGIQSIYSDTDEDNLASTTASITDDLMDAIDSNNAVAIDIGELKTSDEYTFKHSVDVATISMILAKQQGLSRREIYEIGICGLLHDVGKTKVPLEILNKPGRLDDEEFEIMKQHSVFGYRMIKDKPDFSNTICLGVLQHHEKINGAGYPMGVAGKHISPYARIISIADIYDALITERPYKQAFTKRDAVEMIMSMTGELDINAMKSFLESMILYPVGSIVDLSNGEKAKVVKNSPHYILRPTVVGVQSGRVYDLGEDLTCANIIIL